MPAKNTTHNDGQADKPKRRPPAAKPARNDAPETAPVILNAAHVLGYAMKERGLTDLGLANALFDLTGARVSDETIRSKRTAKSAMSLVQLEEFAMALDIPIDLFIKPFSATKFFFAHELQELEKMREESRSTGRDLGFGVSRWNTGTPGCDPEIGVRDARSLAAVGA